MHAAHLDAGERSVVFVHGQDAPTGSVPGLGAVASQSNLVNHESGGLREYAEMPGLGSHVETLSLLVSFSGFFGNGGT